MQYLLNETFTLRALPLSLVSSRSVLSTARTLDPSAYLPNAPTSDAASVAKVVVSFVQIMATTPMALVVRHSDSLRSFLGGLDTANFSAPKVIMVTGDLTRSPWMQYLATSRFALASLFEPRGAA